MTKHGFYVDNLSEEYVTGYEDATQFLMKGLSNRKVAATIIKSKSSRSHIVFTCVIEFWCNVLYCFCLLFINIKRVSIKSILVAQRQAGLPWWSLVDLRRTKPVMLVESVLRKENL